MSVFNFTPGLMSGEQIARTAVGREGLLSHSAEKICNAMRDGRTIDMIFVGPRGIGKSHTALRLVSELENAATPVRLSEEEYSVSSLSEFFSKVLHALGESADPDAVEHARQVFQTRREQGRPVVILAENMQMLFSEMEQDLPHLRSIILEDQSFFIVGTALSTFDQITLPSAAFYNFFEVNKLKGLDAGDIGELVRLRTGGRPNEARPDSATSPAALRLLTGGNPRLVHMLCDIMAQKPRGSLEEHFADLLDRLTPFYRAKMEAMPSEKRRVFDALALSRGPSTPTEIADKLELKNTIVTAHLARLRSDGIVGRVKMRQKKETRYQVTDRLYRMWREFRTRGGSPKTTAFVRLLESWHSQSDERGAEPADAGGARSGLYRVRCASAMPEIQELEDAVELSVCNGDYRGAESAIKDFRDRRERGADPLLAACAEIVAKNAELHVHPGGRKDRARDIFKDMEKADRMLKNCKNPGGPGAAHAVSRIIECAMDLGDFNLARRINDRARSRLAECACMCFAHHQISIMAGRRDYAGALKAVDDALGAKKDPALIGRRALVRASLGDETGAVQDAQLLSQSDEFLHVALCTYSRLSMFADVGELLREKSPAVKSMEKKKRDSLIERLLTDVAEALHGRAPDYEGLTKCARSLKPFVTPGIVSSSPTRLLVERSRGEGAARALDALFEAFDGDQLGMLAVLKCAVDYARSADADSLERLHPEQRELALEMISDISPDARIPQEAYDSV